MLCPCTRRRRSCDSTPLMCSTAAGAGGNLRRGQCCCSWGAPFRRGEGIGPSQSARPGRAASQRCCHTGTGVMPPKMLRCGKYRSGSGKLTIAKTSEEPTRQSAYDACQRCCVRGASATMVPDADAGGGISRRIAQKREEHVKTAKRMRAVPRESSALPAASRRSLPCRRRCKRMAARSTVVPRDQQ
jgi:hypothetical protein